jgi:hypothetical protein
MKNVLIRNSFIYLFIFCFFCSFNNKQIKSNKKYIIQDSLIIKNKYFNRFIYFGYVKNKNDSTKWNDLIKIYHINKKDTIFKTEFIFYRQNEEILFLSNKSFIPYVKIGIYDFIIRTSLSNKGNYSENIFSFNSKNNKYYFNKRINFMESNSKDTLGLKTIFQIDKIIPSIDSLILDSIFKKEYDIYQGKRFKDCKWILKVK